MLTTHGGDSLPAEVRDPQVQSQDVEAPLVILSISQFCLPFMVMKIFPNLEQQDRNKLKINL